MSSAVVFIIVGVILLDLILTELIDSNNFKPKSLSAVIVYKLSLAYFGK